jgi:hypothetical protein
MDKVSEKSVVIKCFKNMIALGLGLAVIVGFAPITALAGFENPARAIRHFNGQVPDSHLIRVSADERVIIARGGNRSGGGKGGGSGTGQQGGSNSERGYKYGPGDGSGTGERPGDGSGYGAKKGAGSGDCDGAGQKGKGRGKRMN